MGESGTSAARGSDRYGFCCRITPDGMHGASRAHGSLELALAAANVAAVHRSRQLGPHRRIED
jgi:hypothetical protein